MWSSLLFASCFVTALVAETVDTCKCGRDTPSSVGEPLCEGHGFNKEQCAQIGCCEYGPDCHFYYVGESFNTCSAPADVVSAMKTAKLRLQQDEDKPAKPASYLPGSTPKIEKPVVKQAKKKLQPFIAAKPEEVAKPEQAPQKPYEPVTVGISTVEPQDGLLVYIYNNQYQWSRLADNGDGCFFYNGQVYTDQLWRLEEDAMTPGAYFLVNFAHPNDRYVYNGDTFCYDGPRYTDQLWTFENEGGNSWIIKNYAHPDCRLANWADASGGAYCGPVYSDQYFRLEPAFSSSARWNTVDDLYNTASNSIHYTFKYSEGISSSIENTISTTQSASFSLQTSIGASLEGIGSMSADMTSTVSSSFTQSYQNAMSHTWSVERTLDYDIPPGTHVCMKQLSVMNVDNSNDVSFNFDSKLTILADGSDCGSSSLEGPKLLGSQTEADKLVYEASGKQQKATKIEDAPQKLTSTPKQPTKKQPIHTINKNETDKATM